MEDKEITRVFSDYLFRSTPVPGSKEVLKELIAIDPAAREVLITKLNNYFFRTLMKEFDLPVEYAKRREKLERDVVDNYQKYDYSSVREAVSDLLFHNSGKNARLLMESIKERAKSDKEFNEKYKPYATLFEAMKEFLNIEGQPSQQEFGEKLNKLFSLANSVAKSGMKPYEALESLFYEAQAKFDKELEEGVNENSRVLVGIKPDSVTSQDGTKVPVYKLRNQTENQRAFTFLIRTIYVSDELRSEGAMESYLSRLSRSPYASFSIINQSRVGGFASRSRVVLGFSSRGDGELLSSNTADGQTNQYAIKKGKFVIQQQVMPLEQFIKQTGKYNEVVFTNPQTIKPKYLMTFEEQPSSDTIEVAKAMGLPIVYIDKTFYEQYPTADDTKGREWFDYESFLKTPLKEQDDLESEM